MFSKGKVPACQSGLLDMLSTLPENVIDDILVLLPLRDAVRTSILSNKWRYNWCRLPQLILDETLWETAQDFISPTIGFTSIIYHLLAFHTEPITKFTLSVSNFGICPNIDVLINFLSRNGIQDLVLHLPWLPQGDLFKLPSSFFACMLLRHLTLINCSIPLPPPAFKGFSSLISLKLRGVTISCELLGRFLSHSIQHLSLQVQLELPSSLFTCMQLRHLTLLGCSMPLHPPTFKGFDILVRLELIFVTISSKLLQSLISHSPLLEQLYLQISLTDIIEINAPMLRSFVFMGDIRSIRLKNIPLLVKLSLTDSETYYLGAAGKYDVAIFFECVSVLEDLDLDHNSIKILAARDGEIPTRHPFVLNSVKRLCLSDINLSDLDVVLCALCLLQSLPYLQYMEIQVDFDILSDSALKSPKVEAAFVDLTFNHLTEVELHCSVVIEPAVQLMKFLLAKCPVLVKMLLVCLEAEDDEESAEEMVAAVNSFQRASPDVEVVYKYL